ncbi:hypothetical protein [Actinomadura opuntiae]|uniref:hypothetical protein n=1 Tax=Actinomadura sp. OS1-43 TaxID=604315 RepID=UPI00255B02AC|nr:hypothetical protein [Actinomadura sp. OS1-43]MDL4817209.1 hypothetical protein [Actinomadura sp. OS1-43]
MRMLRLISVGERAVLDWCAHACEFDRKRIAEVLATFADGTWQERGWWDQFAADPGLIDLRPDEGLFMYLRPQWDEALQDWCADVLFLHRARPDGPR